MDTEDGERITAEYVVNNFTEEQLANIIWKVNALVALNSAPSNISSVWRGAVFTADCRQDSVH